VINLQNQSRYERPYPLTYFRGVWSSYGELLGNLPDDRFYTANEHGGHCGAARASLSLVPRRLSSLPNQGFWCGVRDALHSAGVRQQLEDMFKVPLAHPFACLVRDKQGHYIDVHPDWSMKVLTVQFYLPADTRLRALGTSVHDESKGLVRTLDFLPNTGYAFARSDSSFHSLRELPEGAVRDTLMLTYNREPHDEF
jgi:hypothetical protein